MTLHVNDAGTWRQATEVHVKDGGAWRNCTHVYVKDGGAWREVFGPAGGSYLTYGDYGGGTITANEIDPNDAYAGVRFNTDGTIDVMENSSNVFNVSNADQWFGGTPGATRYIRATLSAGTTPNTGTIGSWEALTSARSWTRTRTTVGTNTSTLLFEISSSATGPADVSGTYILQPTVEA